MIRSLALLLLASTTLADGIPPRSASELPPELEPFVERGTRPLDWDDADLNGDGLSDFVLVLERQPADPPDSDAAPEALQRIFLVVVRRPGGVLEAVKRNEKLVMCSTCGGTMGDPFVGVQAGPKTFSVSHYGGSAWRWGVQYRFDYSRRDDTWQLVRVEQERFHASEPDDTNETAVYTPPEHYGKIDLADFDPETWRDGGER